MKRVIHGFCMFAAACAVFFFGSSSVNAQPVGAVIYDFSGYNIPAGQAPILDANQNITINLLAKNPDGSFAVDAAGNFYADPTAVTSFVSSLSAMYSIPGSSQLDQVTETQYLINILNTGSFDYAHKPSFIISSPAPAAAVPVPEAVAAPAPEAAVSVPAEVPAADSSVTAPVSSSTYVDVNLGTQKLVYFVNGTPAIISDIVTGNVSRGRGTPTGVFAVYGKATNRTLRGPGYEAHVNYWMPFYKGYGLHDAGWRGSFGGSIYQSNGSHGCINMPGTTASALYNSIAVGTPVVIHA